MLAADVRLDLGIATLLTAAAAAFAVPRATPASAPAMPGPTPEVIATPPIDLQGLQLRQQQALFANELRCDSEGITTVVVRGKLHALDPDLMATFHFRFADLPSRYVVTTGAEGAFEVRIDRAELGDLDLCDLPMSGKRPARFADASMTLHYEVSFER